MSVVFGHPPTPVDRYRRDRCPGVLAPWPADDGALVRVRLPGGRLGATALLALLAVAEQHGDGRLHVTGRANLQLRALPAVDGVLDPEVATAIAAAGLLPSPAHDRARNLLASPLTGLVGGRADLRPVVAALDAGLQADPLFAALPGRFLFTLDDGRGDLAGLAAARGDLGLVALDVASAQLRFGADWGEVVGFADAPTALLDLARAFLGRRGDGVDAPWHVRELPTPLAPVRAPAPGADVVGAPLPHGPVAGAAATHHAVGDDGVGRRDLADWGVPDLAPDRTVVVTPWRGVVVPHPDSDPAGARR